jgi:DHA1 family tetracycline resistance protein-like MFS transporter
MSVYGLAPTATLFMLGIPLTAFYGLANPSLRSLMTRAVGPTEQGQLQGANASVMGIASLIAPILFTQTFAGAVKASGAWHLPGAPFLLAAALLMAALFLGARATGLAALGERQPLEPALPAD